MNEISIYGEVTQPLLIDYNKDKINEYVIYIKNKFGGLVVTRETMKDAESLLANINKVKKQVDRFKIDTSKEASKPIDEFKKDMQQITEALEEVYRNGKNQVDEFKQQEIDQQTEVLVKIFNEELAKRNIQELSQFITLPEQTGELSRASFTENKARFKISELLDKIESNKASIDNTVDILNEANKIHLNPKDFYKYMEHNFKEIVPIIHSKRDEQIELKNKIKEDIKEEIREEVKQEVKAVAKQRKKGINIIINTSDLALEIAKELKAFLDSRNIKYIKEEIGE